MLSRLLAALTLVSMGPAAMAQPLAAPVRAFEGRDLFDLQYASDAQVRPDGEAVAYVRVSYDVMQDRPVDSIWLLDVKTGAETPVAAGGGNHNSPRWSPDGRRLAFVSTADGGRPQLFVRWVDSGATARITDLTSAPSALAWSPDGRSIAFLMHAPDEGARLGQAPAKPEGAQWAEPLQVITDLRYRADGAGYLKPGFNHVFVVAATGGAPRQLTFGPYNERGPLAWSPDGRSLYVAGLRKDDWQRNPLDTEIYRVGLGDASIEALTHREGPDASPAVSPDGSKLAYVGFDDRRLGYQNARLYVLDLKTGQSRSITDEFDRTVAEPQWSGDGRSVYVSYGDHGVTKVARVNLDGRLETVAAGLAGEELDRPYTDGEFTVSRSGVVAFASTSTQRPPEVSVASKGRTMQLTHLNDVALADKSLGAVTPLQVKSSFDQRPIDAWVVTPPGYDKSRKYPTILEIHGGPFAAYGPAFATDYQLYAAAGYVVVYANPRGSTTYGEEFANLIHHAYPGHDYDDLMSVVDAAVAQGYADPDNLFVTGGSGGGVLTAWIVGSTHRFRAAASQKPVINWTSEALTTDISAFMTKYWFGAMPWEDPKSYWDRSPLSRVGNVTTPTLVVVGDHDFRTPASDAEQFYEALQLRGIPTALIKVPGASHGGLAARPSQAAAKASAILAWFDRYRSTPAAR